MDYKDLEDLEIETKYTAKEVDLVVFNQILLKIKNYINDIKANMDLVKDNSGSGFTEYSFDNTTTAINVELETDREYTFVAEATSVDITIPVDVAQGYHSSIVFQTGDAIPEIIIHNLASYPTQLMCYGVPFNYYDAKPNTTNILLLFCDGIHTYIYVNEV